MTWDVCMCVGQGWEKGKRAKETDLENNIVKLI